MTKKVLEGLFQHLEKSAFKDGIGLSSSNATNVFKAFMPSAKNELMEFLNQISKNFTEADENNPADEKLCKIIKMLAGNCVLEVLKEKPSIFRSALEQNMKSHALLQSKPLQTDALNMLATTCLAQDPPIPIPQPILTYLKDVHKLEFREPDPNINLSL